MKEAKYEIDVIDECFVATVYCESCMYNNSLTIPENIFKNKKLFLNGIFNHGYVYHKGVFVYTLDSTSIIDIIRFLKLFDYTTPWSKLLKSS